MKFSGRLNSFISKGDKDIYQTIEAYKSVKGITHMEFNYPEHIVPFDLDKIKKVIDGRFQVNGVATRFKDRFIYGEFTNPDETIRQDAINLVKGAVDACAQLNGKYVTVWQAYDGFDYVFQMDYEKEWNRMIEAFREIADYAQDKGIKISIEYKPYEPRNYAMLDSVGTTLLAEDEIGRSNMGMTLDFCHMLMKHDNPAYSLALVAKKGRLFGLHMNDGYRAMDSGLIFGSVDFSQCLEFVFYLKKYHYDDVVFFDTFPVRENTAQEIEMNIQSFKKMDQLIDEVGMEKIEKVINTHDGVKVQELLLSMIR